MKKREQIQILIEKKKAKNGIHNLPKIPQNPSFNKTNLPYKYFIWKGIPLNFCSALDAGSFFIKLLYYTGLDKTIFFFC